ncbi:hypothetical protein [Enterococcus termitis]|jgi:hypothetical protein|uniref:Uncharacterized protein n=1 Tax=Enterococcus termitis TaxID=332950 RepID=A0A1E5H709_9ENTE|nr:hypothetical protein [Enterococcus termitis]OEG20636.1 hypothetical protein BCR25_02125 [Enterococcus termitis]OJG99795.1 hypothetical protein RV18_GL000134 [Enterococcus termitis]
MENPTQIKRKHFRFPAYDDDLGVKLTSENKRTLFQDEPMLTNTATQTQQQAPVIDPVTVQPMTTKQPTQTNNSHVSHSPEQMAELAQHKSNLPNYMMSHNKTTTKQKPNLFGNMPKRNSYGFGSQTTGRDKKNTSRNYTYEARSYFVPKYIPASVIPESKAPALTEQELTAAMKKDQNSYLLFDDEPAAFQVKGNEDPTVKKFNIPKETPEIPVTRRQYQQIKPDMERFGKEDISQTLPRSRKELKTAKENAKSQTAYGQKVAEAEHEKKRGILDKSLSGIIEDSNMELENSKYFN